MARVFIGVGSNIDPEENVRAAICRLGCLVHLTGVSTFYRTMPLGRAMQPPFVNGIIEVETDLSPIELKFDVLRRIEHELGRHRGEDKYAPRTIDLDVLVYDEVELALEGILLPDPEIIHRPFLAVPLAELAPELMLPGVDRCMREIAAVHNAAAMEPLEAYTADLRKEIG